MALREERKAISLRSLHGVDAVKLCIKQFLRRMVTKQFSRKGTHDVGEYHDFIRRVVINALAFWNQSSQHPIMTFHRPFFTGCIGMREVYANSSLVRCWPFLCSVVSLVLSIAMIPFELVCGYSILPQNLRYGFFFYYCSFILQSAKETRFVVVSFQTSHWQTVKKML